MERVRVFLVEDDPSVREVIKAFLSEDEHAVVLEAATLEDALRKIREGNLETANITVAIVDGYLPKSSEDRKEVWGGPDVAQAIRASHMGVKIISFSSRPEEYCRYGDIHLSKDCGAGKLLETMASI